MVAQTLPLRTDAPRYALRVDLDAQRYSFEFEWNDRAGAWFFNLLDASEDPILQGVRVVVNSSLLELFRDPRLPPGVLFAADSTGLDLDPGLTDLGDRVQLVYYPLVDLPSEVVAARGR